MCVEFDELQMKPLLCGLINQIILPLNEVTINIHKGDKLNIKFKDNFFTGYQLFVTSVSLTSLCNVTSEDIDKNGFVYKPSFFSFMMSRNINVNDSIVKLDFKLVES